MSALARPSGLERIAADRRHLIAAQVRCSSGFTWARVPSLPQAVRPRVAIQAAAPRTPAAAATPSEDSAAMAQRRAAALGAWLRGRPEGAQLPAPAALAWQSGMGAEHAPNVALSRLARAFVALEEEGELRTVAGSREAFRGERLVILRCGRVLSTAGAPAHWADRIRVGR